MRLHGADRFADVAGMQAPGQEQRQRPDYLHTDRVLNVAPGAAWCVGSTIGTLVWCC